MKASDVFGTHKCASIDARSIWVGLSVGVLAAVSVVWDSIGE